jgi:RNA polymerase sigma-70 factor (ECF subfamily)
MASTGAHIESWLKLRDGDENAMLHLYQEHYLGLMNYGVKLSGDKELAADCITQVLINLWDKHDRLPEVQNVRSYLLTCMRRQVIQEMQLKKKRNFQEAASQQQKESAEWSYEEYLVQLESNASLQANVKSAFQKLSGRQRELLRLKFFEDLDYDEIASRCGITKRTAYNIIYDALSKLRDDLNTRKTNTFLMSLSFPAIVVCCLELGTRL